MEGVTHFINDEKRGVESYQALLCLEGAFSSKGGSDLPVKIAVKVFLLVVVLVLLLMLLVVVLMLLLIDYSFFCFLPFFPQGREIVCELDVFLKGDNKGEREV